MIDIDELYYDAVDLLKAMISTKSISREEKDVADVIEAAMRGFGLDVRRSGNNLWTVSHDFDPSKPTLLLNSHIDTVKPVEGWSRDPFVPEEDDDGRLYGLGSNDAGASVVSLMAAFRYVTAKEQPCNYVLLASCEEEVSGRGGVESVLPMLPHIDVAIVGEPTSLQPAIAEKGLMVLDGVATGVSGHAARNEGVNAIYKALEAVERLRSVHFERESAMLGPVKVSVTQINAGTQHNVVPDRCEIPKHEVDYIFDLDDEEYAGLTAFAKKVAAAMKKVMPCKRIGVAVLGLEVPHTHIHLVPINKESDMNFFKEKLSLPAEEMAEIAAKIAGAF